MATFSYILWQSMKFIVHINNCWVSNATPLRSYHNLRTRSAGALYLPNRIPMLIENKSLLILFECFCMDRDVAVRPLQMWSSQQTWLGGALFVLIISAAPSTLESSVCPRIQLFADQFLYNLEERATWEVDQICGVGYQEAPDKEVILTQTHSNRALPISTRSKEKCRW